MLASDKEVLKKKILGLVEELRARQQYERAYYWKGLPESRPVHRDDLTQYSCVFHEGNELTHLMGFLKPLFNQVETMYVSIGKTFEHIQEVLDEDSFGKLFILDFASNNLFSAPKEPKNCMYVDRPPTLRELMNVVKELASAQGAQLIVVDALTDFVTFSNTTTDGHRDALEVLRELKMQFTTSHQKLVFLFDSTRGKQIHVPVSYFNSIYEIQVIKELMKVND